MYYISLEKYTSEWSGWPSAASTLTKLVTKALESYSRMHRCQMSKDLTRMATGGFVTDVTKANTRFATLISLSLLSPQPPSSKCFLYSISHASLKENSALPNYASYRVDFSITGLGRIIIISVVNLTKNNSSLLEVGSQSSNGHCQAHDCSSLLKVDLMKSTTHPAVVSHWPQS